MKHRVQQTRFVHYNVPHVFWECSCGRSGTVIESWDVVDVAASAHVPEGECVTLVDAPKEES